MKRFLMAALIAVLGVGFVATEADAKRLGAGTSQGMKRQTPPPQQQAPAATPNNNATAAAAAPAAAPKRSWMGPIAGLAAGLGIAALMSHLGMGAAFGNFIMMALLALVAFIAIRFVMSRMRPRQQLAGAGANMPFSGLGNGAEPAPVSPQPFNAAPALAAAGASAAPAAVGNLPAGFDTAGFERIAKMIFIRMQAANDAGNVEDLRQFATPEMFAAFRVDLQDRKGTQQTDVVQLDAQVLDYAEEAGKQIVSVRFHGLLREESGGVATPFDETWHLVKPADGSSPQWLIAGIAQNEYA